MNWHLRRHPIEGITAAIADYKAMAAEAIEGWLEMQDLVENVEDKYVDPYFTEFPSEEEAGIAFHEFRYRFHFTTMIGGLKLGKVPYNIKIERADGDTYWDDFPEKEPKWPLRVRRIESPYVIE